MTLKEKVIVFDGAMGSEIEARGYGEFLPEDLNISHPEVIREIHLSYKNADIITTNTFGLNGIKYKGAYKIEDVARAAVENARVAGKKVFFDVGPTGALIEPVGQMTFDEAYNAYAEIAEITKDIVDGYIVETFSDLYEIKACILALKEHADKPVFATMTFDAMGRTLGGTTPEIASLVLEGLGVAALGVNCSLGPKQMADVVERFLFSSNVPVIVQPNRGLPKIKDGKTCYDMSADEFFSSMVQFVKKGVSVIGGCCGTTPQFIDKLCSLRGKTATRQKPKPQTAIASASRLVVLDGVKVCGERLNPTGKKKLKEALEQSDYDYLALEAVTQKDAGADLLDLNVGMPTIDETQAMAKACKKVQSVSDLPLQIDSSNKDAIEIGVRYYCGLPLINSVNGEEEVMARVFPIAKKYGAVVLGLTMDERGVPKTAKERFEIAKRIISRAEDFGIEKHKIMIDTLTLTASAEQALVSETLEAIRLVKKLGVSTALGVSNVSFGLPNRPLLNRTFLSMALQSGLNMPIMNPLDSDMTATIHAYKVLKNLDSGAENYIDFYRDFVPQNAASAPVSPQGKKSETAGANSLFECIVKGLKKSAEELTLKELTGNNSLDIVNEILIPALSEVGRLYESGAIFLPQLISSAEAAKTAFAVLGEYLPRALSEKGNVVLATVKGDVHDIGKNIVKVVLESHGYNVIDLGKDTPEEKVVDAAKCYNPIAVGLSALMTTTVPSMERTIKALHASGCKAPVFVGGAVLTEQIAKQIGADYYTKDATEFVKILETL